jgi:TetR/AcrR family transcriptional regulator, repressor for neighboring sulfatase
MAAVQQAAVELLAERGPREVTVRTVAARAGVNHALIHRHFGTKDALIRAVVSEQSREIGARAAELRGADPATMLRLLQEQPAYWRVLARITLDEPDVLAGEQLPAAAAGLAMLAGGSDADEATRLAAAVAASAALGWLVFGPHLTRVLKLTDTDEFDRRVAAAVGSGARAAGPRQVRSGRGGRADPAG